MYLNYWRLNKLPFQNVPDTKFFYRSPLHQEALVRFLYTIFCEKGCIMLTGNVGMGKTLLSRTLFQYLQEKHFEVIMVVNPRLNARELLKEFLFQFDIKVNSDSKSEILNCLYNRIYEITTQKRHTVIIVDEAQGIPDIDVFEELRMLLNFQLNQRFLLTLLLIGQPELIKKVKEIPQLDQRISLRYHLSPLRSKDTVKYIFHRLAEAGLKRPVFTDEALKKIHEYSGGIPRIINNLCDLCLIKGFMRKLQTLDGPTVDASHKDLTGEGESVQNV